MPVARGLRIVDDWKGMVAVFDGDKLVTRTTDLAKAEAYVESVKDGKTPGRNDGQAPFASKVAPLSEKSES